MGKRRKFTSAFKEEAVRRLGLGVSVAEVAKACEVNANVLHRWRRRAGFMHPVQEAPEAQRRLREQAAPEFDEFLVLRFKATNEPPYPFEWVNYNETRLDYAATLSRISARYQQRF